MTPMQRAAMRAHAASAGYRRRIADAMRLIAEHPDYAVSVSWGKDSVVLLHMDWRVHGRVMAVHGRYNEHEELPDIPVVRDRVLAMLGGAVRYVEAPVRGDWELCEIVGGPLWEPETPEHNRILREIRAEFVDRLEDAAKAMGAHGMMIGLAAHESRARKINAAVRGCHYHAKGRLPTLAPLQWLQPDDIIAYHVEHDLPWLRIYDVAPDPRRARSEISMATGGGSSISRRASLEDICKAYPGYCRRWLERWPQMMAT